MRRAFRWLLSLLVVAALVAGGVYAYKRTQAGDLLGPAATGSNAPTSALSPADQKRLEDALNSGDPRVQATALTQEFAAAVGGQAVMSGGASISFQSETFHSSGNVGVVDTTLQQNGQTSPLALLLSRTGSEQPWLVLSSLPQVVNKAYTTDEKSVVTPSAKLVAQTAGCDSVPKGQTPVLFVHGFNEGPEA